MTERTEANPTSALGGRREQRQRVRRDAKLLEKVMLDNRIGIESDGIRMLDLAHDLPGQIRMWLVQGRLHFRVDSETHRRSPQLLSMPSGSSLTLSRSSKGSDHYLTLVRHSLQRIGSPHICHT